MEQSKEKNLVRGIVEIMLKNDVNPIYPERIATPLGMLTEDVKDILSDLADEFDLRSLHRIHCVDCGEPLAEYITREEYSPSHLEALHEPLICDACNSLTYPLDSAHIEVFGYDNIDVEGVLEKIIFFLSYTGQPAKIYPMEVAKLLNRSFESVVNVLADISYLNREYELICPHCCQIQGVFRSIEASQLSGCNQFLCDSCKKDLGPICDEVFLMVFRADGTERGKAIVSKRTELAQEQLLEDQQMQQAQVQYIPFCQQGVLYE